MRTLLYNARVLTLDEKRTEHLNGWILIDGQRIKNLGSGSEPDDIKDIDARIDMGGDLLMPGMINTHCHMAMTVFRGLGEDVDDRLFRYILPLEREAVTPDVVRSGSELAALEMIMGGVTTVADMYWFEQEVGRVIDQSGMRGVVGQTLANFTTPDHDNIEEGFKLVDALRDEFAGHDRVIASIAPHAPYSTGPKVMEQVARYADDNPDVRIQMHLAEMKSEIEWCAEHFDSRPILLADATGILKPGAIMAHCLEVTTDEMNILATRGIGVAHNARSNAKAGRGIAPIEAMRRRGIPCGLATDGPMSGNTLDVFAQMAPASMFAKLLGQSRASMPARDIIDMATREGARVLGLSDQIGTLEAGKKADIVRVSLMSPRFTPIYDIYASLVFAALPTDVTDVMVDGNWILRDGEVLQMESAKVMRKANQVAKSFVRKIDLSKV